MVVAFQIFKRPGLPVWAFGLFGMSTAIIGSFLISLHQQVVDDDPWENSWDRQLVRISFGFEPMDIFHQLLRIIALDLVSSLILG